MSLLYLQRQLHLFPYRVLILQHWRQTSDNVRSHQQNCWRVIYTERVADAGIEASVGGVGDSYDNALAEKRLMACKAEVIHRQF